MKATKVVVWQTILAARDLVKCHPPTPELATFVGAPDADILAAATIEILQNNCIGNSNFVGQSDSALSRTSE